MQYLLAVFLTSVTMLLHGIFAALVPTVTYADALPGLSVYVRAADAVVLTPTTPFPVPAHTDVTLTNLMLNPITFGHVAPDTGKVVDGQFLLSMSIDLGTAPLRDLGGTIRDQQGNLVGFNVPPSNPRFSATFALGPSFVLQPNDLVVAFDFSAVPDLLAPIGAEGDVTLRLALVQSPNESLDTAPGVTLSIRYLIRDQRPTVDLRGGGFLVTGGATQPHSDHFKCYRAHMAKGTPKFEGQTVFLEDQFAAEDAVVLRPIGLCNPVSIDGKALINPAVHQVCYQIKSQHFQDRNVLVGNQFGEHTLTVEGPQTLCVPSSKREVE